MQGVGDDAAAGAGEIERLYGEILAHGGGLDEAELVGSGADEFAETFDDGFLLLVHVEGWAWSGRESCRSGIPAEPPLRRGSSGAWSRSRGRCRAWRRRRTSRVAREVRLRSGRGGWDSREAPVAEEEARERGDAPVDAASARRRQTLRTRRGRTRDGALARPAGDNAPAMRRAAVSSRSLRVRVT